MTEETQHHPIQYVEPPPRYGLNYDETFLSIRRQHAIEDGQLVEISANRRNFASFLRLRERKAGVNLQGLVPLCTTEEAPFHMNEAWNDADYKDFAKLLNARRDWHLCYLSGLRRNELDILGGCFRELKNLQVERLLPIRVISGCRSFEEYEKCRSSSFNKVQRKTRKKALEAGFEFRTEVGIENWADLYLRRNLGPNDYAVNPGFHRFLGKLRERMHQEGRLVEIGLWLKDRIAAAGLALRRNGVLYFYQTAHDPAFSEVRPGAILFDEMFRRGFQLGDTMISFLGNSTYHQLFTRQVLSLYQLEVSSKTIMGHVLHHYRKFRHRQLGKHEEGAAAPA